MNIIKYKFIFNMEKDFNKWNELKKSLEKNKNNILFKE